MRAWVRQYRALSRPARLLVVNQLGISTGFYMVLPFLAGYLTDDLGYGAGLVGVVLGVRTLSQQGLYLLGGSAADRIGPRPVIILGCALRVLAFGLFALVTTPVGILAATVATGVAGALFSPAVRTYLAHEAGGSRAEAFAVIEVAGHVGALVGPLLGAALLGVDFRLVAAVACGAFAALTVAQLLALPPRPAPAQRQRVLGSWWEVLGNRRFVAFTLFGSTYFGLYNQLYLVLPVEAQRVTGTPVAVGAVFVLSTLIGIAVQVPVVAWCRARWQPGRCVAAGLALMAVAFLPLAVSAPLLPDRAGVADPLGAVLAGLPVGLGTAVFTVGAAVTVPFVLALLPVLGGERLTGTCYGFFYLVCGVVAAGISGLAGLLLGLPGAEWRWAPAALLVAVGLLGAAGTAILQRRGLLG